MGRKRILTDEQRLINRRENTKKWKKNNPERQAFLNKKSYFKFKYGLQWDQYLKLLEEWMRYMWNKEKFEYRSRSR